MKNTIIFLNAIKAANGNTVTQYEDKIFVVHINIEYGIIVFIISLRILILNINMKNIMFTMRWIKKD